MNNATLHSDVGEYLFNNRVFPVVDSCMNAFWRRVKKFSVSLFLVVFLKLTLQLTEIIRF